MKANRKQGFTLVELLVVISVIAILMSIMFPALRMARKQARKVLCATNMHDWGIAILAYAVDNDSFFPNNGYDPIRDSYDFIWVSGTMSQFFEDYLFRLDKSAGEARNNILFCPTDKWHRYCHGENLQYYIDNGLIGYNPLFGNDKDLLYSYSRGDDYTPRTCPNGLYWVTRKKLGGKYSRGPILSDMMYSTGREGWQWQGIPFSCHASPRDDVPEGGYFLFEDGSVKWYKGVDNGIDSFHGGEVAIGGVQGGWMVYYGLPDIR